MKKSTARYFSLILAFVLISGGLSAFPAAASESAAPDASLVLHYDFEGETIADALKDKAPAGAAEDHLTPTAGAGNYGNLVFDQEKGTIKNISNNAGLTAPPSADTRSVEGPSTWFARFKLKDAPTSEPANDFFLIEMRTFGTASSRPFALQYSRANKKIVAMISPAATPGTAKNYGKDYVYDYESDEYLNVAVAVGLSEGKYKGTIYLSTGFAKTASDWTSFLTFEIGDAIAPVTDANKLFILSNGSAGCAASVTFDDLRLYNRTLTPDEIAWILVSGDSFDLPAPDVNVKIAGYQTGGIAGGKYDLRVIAAIDSFAYESAGFTVTAFDGENYYDLSAEVTVVFKTLNARDGDGDMISVTAESLGGEYLMTLTVRGIPSNVTSLTLSVTPYAVSGDLVFTGGTAVFLPESGPL